MSLVTSLLGLVLSLGRTGGRRQCAQLVVQACLVAATGLDLQNKRTESWEYLLLAYDVAAQAPCRSDRVPTVERMAAALAHEGLSEAAIEARQCVLELLERDGGTHTVAYHMAQAELSVAKAGGGHEDVVEALCGSLRWLEGRPHKDRATQAALHRAKRCILDRMKPARRVCGKTSPSRFELRRRRHGAT